MVILLLIIWSWIVIYYNRNMMINYIMPNINKMINNNNMMNNNNLMIISKWWIKILWGIIILFKWIKWSMNNNITFKFSLFIYIDLILDLKSHVK